MLCASVVDSVVEDKADDMLEVVKTGEVDTEAKAEVEGELGLGAVVDAESKVAEPVGNRVEEPIVVLVDADDTYIELPGDVVVGPVLELPGAMPALVEMMEVSVDNILELLIAVELDAALLLLDVELCAVHSSVDKI